MYKNTLNQNHLNMQQNIIKCESHNHKFELQQDGHCICKNCNLMIEVPEHYDSQILSFADYLKVFSLQLLFAYLEMLILSKKEKNQLQNTVNRLINNIRKNLNIQKNTNIYNPVIKKIQLMKKTLIKILLKYNQSILKMF